jgi:hypothetical protein
MKSCNNCEKEHCSIFPINKWPGLRKNPSRLQSYFPVRCREYVPPKRFKVTLIEVATLNNATAVAKTLQDVGLPISNYT